MGEPADYLFRALMGANEIEQDRARTAIARAAEERNAAYMETERRAREYMLAQQKAREAEQENVLGLIRTGKEHPYITRPGAVDDAVREAMVRGSLTPESAAIATGDITPGMTADAFRVASKLALGAPDLQAGDIAGQQLKLQKSQLATNTVLRLQEIYPRITWGLLRMSPEQRQAYMDNPALFVDSAEGKNLLEISSESDRLRAEAAMLAAQADVARTNLSIQASTSPDALKRADLEFVSRYSTNVTNLYNAIANLLAKDASKEDLQSARNLLSNYGKLAPAVWAMANLKSDAVPTVEPPAPGWWTRLRAATISKTSTPEAPAGLDPAIKAEIDRRLGVSAPSPSPSSAPLPLTPSWEGVAPPPALGITGPPPPAAPPPPAPRESSVSAVKPPSKPEEFNIHARIKPLVDNFPDRARALDDRVFKALRIPVSPIKDKEGGNLGALYPWVYKERQAKRDALLAALSETGLYPPDFLRTLNLTQLTKEARSLHDTYKNIVDQQSALPSPSPSSRGYRPELE